MLNFAKPLVLSLGAFSSSTPERFHHCMFDAAQLYIMLRARHLLHRTPFNVVSRSSRRTHTPFAPLEPSLQSKFRWSYLWYGAILSLGIATGLGARHFAAPLGLPEPGSLDDALILQSLDADIDKLDVVKELRKQSYSVHSDMPLSTTAAGVEAPRAWLEVDLGKSGVKKDGLLDTMSGTRGLGVQRAFWNAETREMVAVVWIGGGLSGWPGVSHGGAIATIFEEAMARMVRGPNGDIGGWTCCRQSAVYSADFNDRASPPPNLAQSDIRETHIQLGLLCTARILRETDPTPDRVRARTRGRAYENMAFLAFSTERYDKEI